MAHKNILVSLDDSETAKQNAKLTLAAMYLEETLNEGLSIEIPSLGVTISRKSIAAPKQNIDQKKSLTNASSGRAKGARR